MVPIKNGPKIKLKSLIILFNGPPFTVHHLKGTDNILSIISSNNAKLATGVYFLNSFFGIKKAVNQGIKKRPVLINATNILILLILLIIGKNIHHLINVTVRQKRRSKEEGDQEK
jgi:hypothetical protein